MFKKTFNSITDIKMRRRNKTYIQPLLKMSPDIHHEMKCWTRTLSIIFFNSRCAWQISIIVPQKNNDDLLTAALYSCGFVFISNKNTRCIVKRSRNPEHQIKSHFHLIICSRKRKLTEAEKSRRACTMFHDE